MKKLFGLTSTTYIVSKAFKGIYIANDENLLCTLGEVLVMQVKSKSELQTRKNPHVTFFFSGGQEAPFDGEKRIEKL